MSIFKVGGKVVAIEDRTYSTASGAKPFGNGPHIKRGDVFIVRQIKKCTCGAVCLDVGFESATTTTTCHKCKNITPNYGKWFVRSSSFVPIEEQQIKQVTYTKILDEIPISAQ